MWYVEDIKISMSDLNLKKSINLQFSFLAYSWKHLLKFEISIFFLNPNNTESEFINLRYSRFLQIAMIFSNCLQKLLCKSQPLLQSDMLLYLNTIVACHKNVFVPLKCKHYSSVLKMYLSDALCCCIYNLKVFLSIHWEMLIRKLEDSFVPNKARQLILNLNYRSMANNINKTM